MYWTCIGHLQSIVTNIKFHTMKTIQFLGKTFNLAINFLTLVIFEREFKGNALDVNQFAEHAIESTSKLAWAMLKANNADCPSYDEMMANSNLEEIANLIVVTQELYMAEMQSKPGDQQPAHKGKKKKEAEPKNE